MANQDFEAALTRYQRNLTDYKVTGNTGLKTAVDTDKAWLDSYIQSLEHRSETQQATIQKFMDDYQTTNPDLVEMQAKLREIRQKGPALQDAYETEQKAMVEEPLDLTPYYVKAGLIVGVAAVVALVGVFRPLYTR